jgi:2-keto-4-pentenoate hydratase
MQTTSDTRPLRSAVAECFVGPELVGRRVAREVPLNEASAIADYALDVAVVRGPPIPDWRSGALDAMPVRAVVDGVTVARGSGANVLGHPSHALAWLAGTLAERGGRLSRGDIVLIGTCTGIAKVAPRADLRRILCRSVARRGSPRIAECAVASTRAHDGPAPIASDRGPDPTVRCSRRRGWP